MMRRFVILCLLMLWVSVPAFAQDNADILRYPILADPEHLNPFTSETIAIGTVNSNFYEGLIRYDFQRGQVVPALAESWTLSQDEQGRMVYTFTLREGVLFHEVDGVRYAEGERELTAEDVLWNYLHALSPDEDVSIRATQLSAIAGAEAYTSGEAETVEGLRVLDDDTFEIILDRPDRLFLVRGAGLAITSPAAYAQLGDDFDDTPVGTGPFRLVEWQRDNFILLEANPDYWNSEYPRLDGIRFINYGDPNTAVLDYREGQLDLLLNIPGGQRASLIEEFAQDYREQASLHVRFFGMNVENGFLAENPLVRQAMNYALDRETAWNIFDEGARIPADLGLLPPAMPAATPQTIYTFDLDRARDLLTEAGYPGGEGIPTITLNVLESISSEAHLLVWQQNLADIGINVVFEVEDGSTYWDTIDQAEMQVFISGWAAGLPDPADVFDFLVYDGDNAMGYDNDTVDALLEQARLEIDAEARTALYQQVHDLVMADSPIVVSAYGKITWLQQPWVAGFVPGSGGAYTAPLWEVSLER